MLFGTFLGLFFIPVFFVAVRKFTLWLGSKRTPAVATAEGRAHD
jgi:hypothetical protein